jgi:hypothetical protein
MIIDGLIVLEVEDDMLVILLFDALLVIIVIFDSCESIIVIIFSSRSTQLLSDSEVMIAELDVVFVLVVVVD